MNWTVEGRGDEFAIVDDMGVEVASVPYTDETGAEPLDTAEGRRAVLLASAPALLAALESIVLSPHAVETKTYRAARAAINKARGTSEKNERGTR